MTQRTADRNETPRPTLQVGLGAGSAHGLTSNVVSRHDLTCRIKTDAAARLQTQINNLPPNAPPALKARLQKRLDSLNAWLIANNC